MKSLLSLAMILVAGAASAHATTYTLAPTPADLGDLEHQNAYIWGLTTPANLANELASGMFISRAQITIKNIWNWNNQANKLFIDLLDNPKFGGVTTVTDNPSDNSISDYFLTTVSGSGLIWSGMDPLTDWSDLHGGSAHNYNLIYQFDAAEIQALTTYVTDLRSVFSDTVTTKVWVSGHWSSGHWIAGHYEYPTNTVNTTSVDFGLAFDPDCHFYNCGITFEIDTSRHVPEGGLTAALIGIALLGLAVVSRRLQA